MSRAFVKESDGESSAGELPERPLGAHANYVTPHGFEQLQVRLKALQRERDTLKGGDEPMARQKLLEVQRDIRYYQAQLDRAQVVDPRNQPHDEVHFGATVSMADQSGKHYLFHIVGDDEADVRAGRISWSTPLARAMIGARLGDIVKWQRPAGASEVEINSISYDDRT